MSPLPDAGSLTQPALQLWGGLECSVVRIRDVWRDQVRETGHQTRPGDLQRIAGLGIRTLRYPVLWERCTEGHPRDAGWDWHGRQLDTLRNLGITPIAGLLHHGMGPLPGGLLDPGFAEGLAVHAGRAAERHGWIRWWTPVNEPLTTARFACLYGHWHPHSTDEGVFLRAVAAQCRAALLAMRAIRAHAPDARFMHTEDVGRVFATHPLSDQADYENERRWLSLDLLCGKVDQMHPYWGPLRWHAVPEGDLDELATGEAAPDAIGANHYVTSDRFLDHRKSLYPRRTHGSNGRMAYADTEAARVDLPSDTTGWLPRLREVWDRYRLPLVLSEAHLGCEDPAEQLRWLMEAWSAAQALRAEGATVHAVTAWALLGLTDWSSMLVHCRNQYEPGAFDVRHDPPQRTPLAEAIASLAQTGAFDHPALHAPGWWRTEDRLLARRA